MAKIRRKTFIVGIDTDKKDFTSWMKQQLKEYRNKAIDDFSIELSVKIMSEIDDCAEELQWIDEIAKRLKER